jgi:SAM-dependent methyltransferase
VTGDAQALNAHYGRADLGAVILEALRAAGHDPERLTPEALAPVDQFHTGGREGTLALARLAGVEGAMRVLDLGGGLGGPARTLAQTTGCHVTVVDLTEAYCRIGADLTRRCGLQDRVIFRHGDALATGLPDGAFDLVWTQHSSMNIPDKPGLYREIRRVLRPGGRFACHEILGGPAGLPPHFPVPWAREPGLSFLRPAPEIRDLIAAAGFVEVAWHDESAAALDWFRQRVAAARAAGGPPPLGLHRLLGPEFGAMMQNQVSNLEDGRIAVVKAVFDRRPGAS